MEFKRCRKCNEDKSTSEFHRSKDGKFGVMARCKLCTNQEKKVYRNKNLDRCRQTSRDQHHKYRQTVLNAYGHVCVCCGETHDAFLSIDHVHGGGTQHRKRIHSGTATYLEIIRLGFPADYQILCHNCNQAKGYYGRCPHQDGVKANITQVCG